ncbi:hypothetical protein [Lactobacillus sp. LL6]|uniref:hypothetical protein n=1 Tax=Lactobacillus sp. LL6 TaxID=2596827 RepID=UPI0011852452|nr:hypothetical protein [Lactobacillus sp. LL6]TSO26431.1 hypothetical protein FOD82_05040 [Lactobacillus sp. LL6]
MDKIIYSGIILLIDIAIFIMLIVAAMNTAWLWWAVVGQIIVSYGVFDWHMGIIHKFKSHQAAA